MGPACEHAGTLVLFGAAFKSGLGRKKGLKVVSICVAMAHTENS